MGCRCGCPGGCPLPLLAGSPLAYVPSAAAWACWCCCSPAFSQIAVQVASLPCVYIAFLDASLLCKHTASCTGAVAGPRALRCGMLACLPCGCASMCRPTGHLATCEAHRQTGCLVTCEAHRRSDCLAAVWAGNGPGALQGCVGTLLLLLCTVCSECLAPCAGTLLLAMLWPSVIVEVGSLQYLLLPVSTGFSGMWQVITQRIASCT